MIYEHIYDRTMSTQLTVIIMYITFSCVISKGWHLLIELFELNYRKLIANDLCIDKILHVKFILCVPSLYVETGHCWTNVGFCRTKLIWVNYFIANPIVLFSECDTQLYILSISLSIHETEASFQLQIQLQNVLLRFDLACLSFYRVVLE